MDNKNVHISINTEGLAVPEVMVENDVKHETYTTAGVCSRQIDFDMDSEGCIHNVKFIGGCNGNLKAIGLLGGRGTSCADQLAKAIDKAMAE